MDGENSIEDPTDPVEVETPPIEPIEGEETGQASYLISLQEEVSANGFAAEKLKDKKVKKIKTKKREILSTKLSKEELVEIEKDEQVLFVEPNGRIEIASIDKPNKKDVEENTQIIPWGLKAIGSDLAHESDFTGKKVRIAVLDTGITDHSDLQVKKGVSFVEGSTFDEDEHGHGTHVAGTIAALNNDEGVVGVAPDADLYAVKVLDAEGNGTYAQVIEGIQWAIDNKVDIISISFGGTDYSQSLHEVIQDVEEEGILILAAAGNLGEGEETELYPALFPEVLSVGAVDSSLDRARYSSTGTALDLVAPGSSIISTLPHEEYGLMSGTSMAVPHVTGAASLLWGADKKLTAEEVTNQLKDTATDLGDAHEYGAGLLNIAKALGLVDEPIEFIDEPVHEQIIKGIPSKEKKEIPQLQGDVLLIAAYFNPVYMDQLDEDGKLALFQLDSERVNEIIADLNGEDMEWLEEFVPVSITQYQYATDPDGYAQELQSKSIRRDRLEKEGEATVNPQAAEFIFTEFNSTYNYNVKSDQYVDPLYHTANRSVTDIYLPGLNGFDVVLNRQYNSLDSKLMKPEAKRGENYTSAIDPKEVKNGFIANGWTLDLPYMDFSFVDGEIIHSTDYYTDDSDGDRVYKSMYDVNNKEYFKMVFTIEDGSSYELRFTDINGTNSQVELVDYPYTSDVEFGVRANGYFETFRFENGPASYPSSRLGYYIDEYMLEIGNTIYFFNEEGQILRKRSNTSYMSIDYEYIGNDILMTDRFGRVVTIYRDADFVIYKIEVVDANGVMIEEINYQTTQTSKSLAYKRDTNDDYPSNLTTESISYWRLDAVMDEGGNVLESYDYYTIDQTTLGDFNLSIASDGYWYYAYSSGNPKPADDEYKNYFAYWADDNRAFELAYVYDTQVYDYAEIPYLLLKNVNFNNGTNLQFMYDKFDPLWSLHDEYEEVGIAEELRNSTRMFVDDFALQYISYPAVNRVLYAYEEEGQPKVTVESYTNEHYDHGYNIKEYFNFKLDDNKRLAQSRTRFGDAQTLTQVDDSTGQTRYTHYKNNGKRFLLAYDWMRDSKASELIFSEDGNEYFSNQDVVTAYRYTGDGFRPTEIHQYTDHIPEYEDVLYLDGTLDWFTPLVVNNVQHPVLPNSGSQIQLQTTTYEYDNYGAVTQETDPLGNVTTYEYNDASYHLLSRLTVQPQDGLLSYEKQIDYEVEYYLPEFAIETYTYQDPSNPSLVRTDSFRFEYEHLNDVLMSLKTYASGDQFGTERIVTEKDFTYTDDAKLKTETTSVTLEEGQSPTSLTIQYDYNTDGTIKEIIYPDTSEVEYDYDYLDRITSYRQVPFGGDIRTTTVDYVNNERKVTVNTPDGEQIDSFYTPFGLNVKQVRNVNEVSKVINEIESNDGIITDVTKPYGNSALGTSYTYDNLNRVMSIEDAEGNITRFYYANTVQGADGKYTLQQTTKIVYPNGKEEISYYDFSGNLVKFVERDVSGNKERITTNQYSSLGQLLETSVTSEGKTQTNKYGYDGTGNLIFLEDNLGQTYKYFYNPLGQVVKYYINDKTDPEVTKTYNEVGWLLTETSPSDDQETYTYNNKGLIETFVDKKGQTFTYTYSPYNEVEHMTVTDNTGQEVLWEDYTYDPETRLPTELANSEGQTLSYTYDEWKRLNTQEIAGNTYTFNYDDFDRLEALVYPDLKQVDYTHDNLSRIQTVSYDGQLMGDYDYTISTNGTSLALNYEPLSMGFQTDINPFGELISHEQKDTGSITWAESFGYDGLGNIVSKDQNGEISTYQYDDLNRIIQEDVVEGIQTYTYDEKGNRKTMEGTMKLPLGPREYTYNALNQLSTFKENDEETTYQYYVGGLRATKESVNGDFTRYIYFQGNVIEELDQEGNPTARNIWGNQLLYREDMTSSLGGYYFYNGHGDVVKVVAADGSKDVLKEYDYDIWGNVLSETSHETKTFDNPFQYTGEIYDEESGLTYLRARYYDPTMGRFITEDTYEGTISNPLSMNLYTYVHNNPLIYTDPSGHNAERTFGGSGYTIRKAAVHCAQVGVSTCWNEARAGVLEASMAVLDFTMVGDISTILDPESSNFDKGLAAASFIPIGKVIIKGGRLIVKLSNGHGREIERAANLTAENLSVLTKSSTLAQKGIIDSSTVRFSQSSISSNFSDGSSVYDLIAGLKSGKINSNDIPSIRIFEIDGTRYTLDNRRLYAFQEAGIDVNYTLATPQEIANEAWKFTTKNNGESIKVRGTN
nr:S8 family serine peptidase [Chengkuizengella sediminis]